MSDVNAQPPSCPICLEVLETVAEVARPSVCGHLFCRSCMESLCRGDPNLRRCPLDRKPFDRICVRPWTQTLETELSTDALQKLLPSHAVAIGLGVCLLAVLWLSPNWLLLGHIAVTCGIYLFTGGTGDCRYYLVYSCVFYYILVPWKFIGLALVFYSCCCAALIEYWFQQIPRMQASGHWKHDRMLLIGTCLVICVIYPAMIFSAYELAQVYCYALWILLAATLLTNLLAAFGQHCIRQFILLSSLLLAPFLCSRQELTLPYLAYSCLVTGYLAFSYRPETAGDNSQQKLFLVNTNLSKLACLLVVLIKALGFSVWPVAYALLAVIYLRGFIIPISMVTRIHERVPILFISNLVVVVALLPCRIFGFLAYSGCVLVLEGSEIGLNLLFNHVHNQSNFQTKVIALQFAIGAILVPGLLLA